MNGLSRANRYSSDQKIMQLEGEITIADPYLTSNERLFIEGLGLVGRQEKERLKSVKI